MSLEAAMAAQWKADGDLATLVGTRVYWDEAKPNSELPYMVFRRSFADHVTHMTGDSGLVQKQYDVRFVAASADVAEDLYEKARLAMPRRATIGSGGNTAAIRDAIIRGIPNRYFEPQAAEASGDYSTGFTIEIWASEAARSFN